MIKKFICFSLILPFVLSSTLSAVVTVEKPAIYEGRFDSRSISTAIKRREQQGRTNKAAKGLVGESVSTRVIEEGNVKLGSHKLRSIQSVFQSHGCEATFKHGGDKGLDNVFVVTRNGWIDERYNPVFHEAKFNGNCRVRLSRTKTLSDQLSFRWLKANLQQAKIKTSRMCITFPEKSQLYLTACDSCKTKFREQISWLQTKLKKKEFYRTVSILCPNGDFKIFNVSEK